MFSCTRPGPYCVFSVVLVTSIKGMPLLNEAHVNLCSMCFLDIIVFITSEFLFNISFNTKVAVS